MIQYTFLCSIFVCITSTLYGDCNKMFPLSFHIKKTLYFFFHNTLILLQVLEGCERSGRVIFSGALESYILKFFLQSYSYQIRGVAI